MTSQYNPVLTDEQIDDAQDAAYRELVAGGFNGVMGGFQWDRASARAIERAAIEAYQRTQWLSIETAPKDGTPLMLYARHHGGRTQVRVTGWWVDGLGWIGLAFEGRPPAIVPTHWQPLPPPSQPSEAENG